MNETPMGFDADPICQVVFSVKSQYTLTMLKSQKKSSMPDESSVFPFFPRFPEHPSHISFWGIEPHRLIVLQEIKILNSSFNFTFNMLFEIQSNLHEIHIHDSHPNDITQSH